MVQVSLLPDSFPSNTPAHSRRWHRKRLRQKCGKPPTTPLLAFPTLNGKLRGAYGAFCTPAPRIYGSTRGHSAPRDLWRTREGRIHLMTHPPTMCPSRTGPPPAWPLTTERRWSSPSRITLAFHQNVKCRAAESRHTLSRSFSKAPHKLVMQPLRGRWTKGGGGLYPPV